MGQLDATQIIKQEQALHSCLDDTDRTLLKRSVALQWKVLADFTDGGTAGTAKTATPIYTNDEGCNVRVKLAMASAPVAITGDNTNNAVFTLDKVDAAGANATTVATFTTNVAGGNWVAAVQKAITLTTANLLLASGWTLRLAISKGGTGVAVASATAQGRFEVTLERE